MKTVMINNAINQAKFKLARHKELGNRSTLSIMEVAQLMDVLTFGPNIQNVSQQPLFFNFMAN